MINDESYEVVKQIFDSFKNRYENNFKSMKGSEFVLIVVIIHLLYHKCHNFPDCVKVKKKEQ